MKVGYIVGVFDQLHYGHKNMIIESLARCDRLIIGVHTDVFTKSYKRLPDQNQDVRRSEILRFINDVASTLYDEEDLQLIDDNHIDLIKKFGITVIYHGDDWDLASYKQQIKFYEHKMDVLGVSIELLPYSRGISSTLILTSDIGMKLQNKQCFLFDLDNTILLDNQPKKFAYDIISKLNREGREIYIITNNNRYTPFFIHSILTKYKIQIPLSNIISTLTVISSYLTRHNYKNIYIWGTPDAKQYFRDQGFQTERKEELVSTTNLPELVVVLYSNQFDYDDLSQLCEVITKVPYIIGNIDRMYPDKRSILPDTGCLWKYLEYGCGKPPQKIFGKPNPHMLEEILETYSRDEIVFIGDSKETDAVVASKNSIDFIHVDETFGDISHLGVLCNYF